VVILFRKGLQSKPMPVSPARAAAFDILLRVERENSYASELLHSASCRNLSTSDHALATELVMGVLRWQSRLDDQISTASSHAPSKLDLEVLISLRLAVYQFDWLTRIPQRAALHESVELVKRARKRSAAPFVNAVLRKMSGTSHALEFPGPDETSSPSILARAFAHPAWMVERWTSAYGWEATRQICQHDQAVPPTIIRLGIPDAESSLRSENITLASGRLLSSARRVESGDITKTHAFRSGQVFIQEEASQLVAALVAAAETRKTRILDCCAAPGGKTLAIADRNPGASITAVEIHPHRARLLRQLLRKSDCASRVHPLVADARSLPMTSQFDRVLADVPCSGTGTLGRNPEIKWRLGAADLADLQSRQIGILGSALARVAPGGRLIYSTCSLEKEENEDVIEQVLAGNISFRLLDCRTELDRLNSAGDLIWPNPASLTRGPFLRTIPGVHPCDGFFAAILERA
jgi:16S rRNA (cytosine967-C5)-methyltransferase